MAYEGRTDYRYDAADFLRGTRFSHQRFAPAPDSDHDHCECCWAKFMAPGAPPADDPAIQGKGYTATIDSGHGAVVYWVCGGCFADLAEPFGWRSD